MFPDLKKYENLVHLIDVPLATGNETAKVVADLQTRHAVCFLEKSRTTAKR